MAVKLGVASGRDLAQACRDHFSRPVSFALWVVCELAIAACDLAEVIGSAIALNLLFGIPLLAGVCITACDVLIVLLLQNKGFRYIEALVISLIAIIGGCFLWELVASQWRAPNESPCFAEANTGKQRNAEEQIERNGRSSPRPGRKPQS